VSACAVSPQAAATDRPRHHGADRRRDLHPLERLDADPELLAIVGSWRDTLPDQDVLRMLRDYNAGRPTLHRAQ
jgi:hypothetical protein